MVRWRGHAATRVPTARSSARPRSPLAGVGTALALVVGVALSAALPAAASAAEPGPVPDDASTLRDRPVAIPVAANDTDPDARRLHVVSQPPGGHATENHEDGTILYTPEPGFTGTDRFPYDYCPVPAPDRPCPFATVTVTARTPDPLPADDTASTVRDWPV